MRGLVLAALMTAAGLTPAQAEGEMAGQFDYYVLSLSWSANWCSLTGDSRGEDQCDPANDFSFTLHGLWPQFATGYPSYCRTEARDPSRGQTAAMADIMGSGGLAWYQWKKHGRCSGLAAAAYFSKARAAYRRVVIPAVFRKLNRDVALPVTVVEQAFTESNPGLTPAGITITCDRGFVQEARICLTKALEFRPCGTDVLRDCQATDAVMQAIR